MGSVKSANTDVHDAAAQGGAVIVRHNHGTADRRQQRGL